VPASFPPPSGLNIASLTPTICDLMGVVRPALCDCEPVGGVLRACAGAGVSRVEKCLVYAPDAVGRHVFARCPDLFDQVLEAAPVVESLRSVFPPKTPVCFASMFTGAPPEAHGIRSYERPVLECDTLFDALIRGGKKPAIAGVSGASVDVIFRGRRMDYYSEASDSAVTARVLGLLEEGGHDFILAYHQEYDDNLHESGVYASASIAAAGRHAAAFGNMVRWARKAWSGPAGLVIFAPDHGAHDSRETGGGTHGEDTDDDMEVLCFFAPVA
jgi:hypothetical protein